jgi:hypothetical protein
MSKTISLRWNINWFGLLSIVFITLKLLGKITWSWVWVLSPMWIPLVAFLIIGVLVTLAFIVVLSEK